MIKNNPLNLDLLLDNDELSPAQERYVRSQVTYRLEVDKYNLLIVSYRDKITGIEFVETLDMNKTNLKRNTYKLVIYSLLNLRQLTIKDKPLLIEVKKVLRDNLSTYKINFPIKEKSQIMYSLLERVLSE